VICKIAIRHMRSDLARRFPIVTALECAGVPPTRLPARWTTAPLPPASGPPTHRWKARLKAPPQASQLRRPRSLFPLRPLCRFHLCCNCSFETSGDVCKHALDQIVRCNSRPTPANEQAPHGCHLLAGWLHLGRGLRRRTRRAGRCRYMVALQLRIAGESLRITQNRTRVGAASAEGTRSAN